MSIQQKPDDCDWILRVIHWEKGTPEQRERCERRCVRRTNTRTFNGGRYILLPRAPSSGSLGEPLGRHLTYQHWRQGHFRTVHFGPSRMHEKLTWIRPLLVRPDLPADPRDRTYAITRAPRHKGDTNGNGSGHDCSSE